MRDGRTARRGWPVPLLFTIAVVALVGGLLVMAAALPAGSTRRVGADSPVDPLSSADKRVIDANNSPTLARDPRSTSTLALANRVDSPRFTCGLRVSTDGGASWIRRQLPFPAGEEEPARCFTPEAAFDSRGTMHVFFVTLRGRGNTPNAGWLVASDDLGRTFTTPVRVLGQFAFQVRLTADPQQSGRLYLTWLQAERTATLAFPDTGAPIMFSRSDDGGSTWSPPVRVSPTDRLRAVAPVFAVAPNDALLVVYLDLGNDALDYHGGHEGRGGEPYRGPWQLVAARSANGGNTWSETTISSKIVPYDRFVIFEPPLPAVAVDSRQGRAYVAYTDARGGDPDVYVWASADGGSSFGTPVRVNDTRPADATSQYLPQLSVAPGGRVDVVYFDRRRDPRRNLANDISFQSSFDGGRDFSPHVRLNSGAFDSRIGNGSERGLADLGSRLALLSNRRQSLAVWPDTRAGTEASRKQDLRQALVEPTQRSALRTPLQGAAIIILAFGLLLAARSARARARQTSTQEKRRVPFRLMARSARGATRSEEQRQ